ncbi:hypothetical protein QJS10_CPA08g01395 [Acorus calamus]|uniref:Uncharacterized protein n=1 Tax=Acorus calamus TaxID=4465 RepID=A0AAV9E9R6_ACOCL|nr:hypothetical protein QJS10_CPA08g01395 [Acorus calamus]
MEAEIPLVRRRRASVRLCNVKSCPTELLEIPAEDPSIVVLFIPGNPGIVGFYRDFIEEVYEQLNGSASVTGKDLVFPIRLLGIYVIRERSPFFSAAISSCAALLGLFPKWASSSLVKSSVGKSWSSTAVDATCNDLLQYHTVRNALYMAMTEFKKLSEDPDWMFIRGKRDRIAFLFGIDDHWGPLSLFEKISTLVPEISLSIEREGHTHAFCCTNAGSVWVASHVARLIKHRMPS